MFVRTCLVVKICLFRNCRLYKLDRQKSDDDKWRFHCFSYKHSFRDCNGDDKSNILEIKDQSE